MLQAKGELTEFGKLLHKCFLGQYACVGWLCSLSPTDNHLGDSGLEGLVAALVDLTGLTHLSLAGNAITATGLQHLAALFHSSVASSSTAGTAAPPLQVSCHHGCRQSQHYGYHATYPGLVGLYRWVSVVFIVCIVVVMLLTLTLLICTDELVWFLLSESWSPCYLHWLTLLVCMNELVWFSLPALWSSCCLHWPCWSAWMSWCGFHCQHYDRHAAYTDLAGLHEWVSVVFIASIMIVMLLTLTLLVCMNELVWFSLPASWSPCYLHWLTLLICME